MNLELRYTKEKTEAIMKNRVREYIEVGGERLLISYSSYTERMEEIRLRENAHKAIEESRREIALIKAVLSQI